MFHADSVYANSKALSSFTGPFNCLYIIGGSHCLPYSTHWIRYAVLIVILIAGVLAGLAFVALLLALAQSDSYWNTVPHARNRQLLLTPQ